MMGVLIAALIVVLALGALGVMGSIAGRRMVGRIDPEHGLLHDHDQSHEEEGPGMGSKRRSAKSGESSCCD